LDSKNKAITEGKYKTKIKKTKEKFIPEIKGERSGGEPNFRYEGGQVFKADKKPKVTAMEASYASYSLLLA